jgi:hypothetical protein
MAVFGNPPTMAFEVKSEKLKVNSEKLKVNSEKLKVKSQST